MNQDLKETDMQPQNLADGAPHAELIGKPVAVDVTGREGRYVVSGVLTRLKHLFSASGSLLKTELVVAGESITLDWHFDAALTATVAGP